MASVVITNVSAGEVHIRDLYKTLAAGEAVTISRTAAEITGMAGLQEAAADGTVTIAYTRSADEVASGLDLPPVVDGGDLAAVASTDKVSDCAVIRIPFTAGAGGSADDVTAYAVNTLPFKFRVLDAWALIATNVVSASVTVRTAAAAGGTLLATLSGNATGRVSTTAPTATAVATPGASAGLFLRRSDSGLAGEVFLLVRKEA